MDPPPPRPQILGLPGPCNGRYELPTLADVRAAAMSPEYRQYLEETVGRRNATAEEIQSAGIRANPDNILQSILEAEEPLQHPQKTSFDGAHKVYAQNSRNPEQQDKVDNRAQTITSVNLEEGITTFWFDTVCNAPRNMLRGAVPSASQFRDAALPRARSVVNAVREWHAKQSLDLVEPDPIPASGFNLFESLLTCPELIIEVGKHLKPKDIINLYSISRKFHGIVDDHMWSTIKTWAEHMAPGSVRIFSRSIYVDEFYIRDPAGRPMDKAYHDMAHITIPERKRSPIVNNEVRMIPGLKWLQMVYSREVRIRDIMATLARMGHRLPCRTDMALKKMWLIMDISTSEGRVAMMRSEDLITSVDLCLLHMFLVKTMLAFNDPIYGPESSALVELMLGQRSLSALWAMLRRKRYTTRLEIRRLKVAYDIEPTPEEQMRGEPVYGVPIHEMGLRHLEGWGIGNEHLLRPDELIFIESARRQLDFEPYAEKMMFYGHIDWETGAQAVPSLEEMYMSDDELEDSPDLEKHREAGAVTSKVYKECGNVPFERWMWQPRDVKKHNHWHTMTKEEQQAILGEEEEEFGQTFDVVKWLFNLRFSQDRLEEMLESVNKNGRWTVDIPTVPAGRVNGMFDRDAFERFGSPCSLETALGSLRVIDQPWPYEAPENYKPNLKDELMTNDQPMWQNFSQVGEDNPLPDDEELDGLGNEPYDFAAELDNLDNQARVQQRDPGQREVETEDNYTEEDEEEPEEEGEEQGDYEDAEMTDVDEEYEEEAEDDYDDDDMPDDVGGGGGFGNGLTTYGGHQPAQGNPTYPLWSPGLGSFEQYQLQRAQQQQANSQYQGGTPGHLPHSPYR